MWSNSRRNFKFNELTGSFLQQTHKAQSKETRMFRKSKTELQNVTELHIRILLTVLGVILVSTTSHTVLKVFIFDF